MSHLLELSAVTSWPSNSYFRSLFCHTVFGLTILALTSSYQKWRHHDVASPKKISSTIIYGFFCKTSRFRINFALKRTLKFLSALDRTLNFCLYYFTVRLFWFCVVQKSNLLLDKRFSVCNSVIGQLLALSILSPKSCKRSCLNRISRQYSSSNATKKHSFHRYVIKIENCYLENALKKDVS